MLPSLFDQHDPTHVAFWWLLEAVASNGGPPVHNTNIAAYMSSSHEVRPDSSPQQINARMAGSDFGGILADLDDEAVVARIMAVLDEIRHIHSGGTARIVPAGPDDFPPQFH